MQWRAVFLVAGTCIGAAALPLPLHLAGYGLLGGLAILFGVGVIMLIVSHLVIEVLSGFEADISYVTMAERTLGGVGKYVTWGAYLALLYALISAYLSGLSGLVAAYLPVPRAMSTSFFALFGLGLLGVQVCWLDRFNRLFSLMLVACFLIMFALGGGHRVPLSTASIQTPLSMDVLAIVMLAFGYQVVIPSVFQRLGHRAKAVSKALCVGSFIPFVLYACWMWQVYHWLPAHGMWGLERIAGAMDPTQALVAALTHRHDCAWVAWVVSGFICSAMLTSFFGIALSLFDLWADPLPATKSWQRWAIAALVMLPAWLFSVFEVEGFMVALKYAAIFVAILSGLCPIAMVLVMRIKHMPRSYVVPMPTWLIAVLSVFFVGVLI